MYRLCIFFLFIPALLRSQNREIDSLNKILSANVHDTVKVEVELLLGELLFYQDENTSEKLWKEAAGRCEKQMNDQKISKQQFIYFKRQYGASLNNLAFLFMNNGNAPLALRYFQRALTIMNELNDKAAAATCMNNLGSIYTDMGDLQKAIDHQQRALKLHESVGNKAGMSKTINNLGLIYEDQKDISKAKEYYEWSIRLCRETKDLEGEAVSLNNLSFIYKNSGDFASALKLLEESLNIRRHTKNKKGTANSLCNIGLLYFKMKNDVCLKYYEESKCLYVEAGSKTGIVQCDACLSGYYHLKKQDQKALALEQNCMKLAKELGYPDLIKSAAKGLNTIYRSMGNYKVALENYELFVKMSDSLVNESNRKASIKSQLKYEYEKQAAADSVSHAKETEIKNAELSRQSAEIKAKKNQQYALFGGLFFVVLFSVFMFNRYKVTQKQKIVIELQKQTVEEQKKLVEEKQKEILDSIHYAKRIQLAQIPSEKRVEFLLNKSSKNK